MLTRNDKLLKLVSGKPLPLSEKVSIHQPKISDIIEISEERFNKLLLPFRLNVETLFHSSSQKEELILKYHVFDLFFIKDEGGESAMSKVFDENAMDILIEALSFFTHIDKDKFQILEFRNKIIVEDFVIDKDSFNVVKDYIQSICMVEDVEIEEPPKNLSPRKRDIYEKIMKGRARKKQKEMLHLCDMYVMNQFGGGYYLSNEILWNMTYYQFHNAYVNISKVESYQVNNMLMASTKFTVDPKDNKHWSETLKLS